MLITFSSSSCTLAAVTALPQSSQKDVWQENKGKQRLSPSTRKNVFLSGYEYSITVPTTTWNFPGTVLEQGSLKSCVREATSTHDLWSVGKMIKSLPNLRGCTWCNFLLYAFKDLPKNKPHKVIPYCCPLWSFLQRRSPTSWSRCSIYNPDATTRIQELNPVPQMRAYQPCVTTALSKSVFTNMHISPENLISRVEKATLVSLDVGKMPQDIDELMPMSSSPSSLAKRLFNTHTWYWAVGATW